MKKKFFFDDTMQSSYFISLISILNDLVLWFLEYIKIPFLFSFNNFCFLKKTIAWWWRAYAWSVPVDLPRPSANRFKGALYVINAEGGNNSGRKVTNHKRTRVSCLWFVFVFVFIKSLKCSWKPFSEVESHYFADKESKTQRH